MPSTGVKTDGQGVPYLEVDDFAEHLAELVASGWVVTDYSRYDPTHIVGLTPSGKTFDATLAGNTVTLTIAGNTRTLNVAKATWLTGLGTVTAITNARASFPSAQR